MLKNILISFLFSAILLYANTSVGFSLISTFSKHRNQNINTMVFYPSLEKENFILGKHKLFIPETVALNGKVKKNKYPLILLSHGGLKSARNQINWLAKSLAKNGFIVLLTRSNFDIKQVLYEPWLRANDMLISFEKIKKNSRFKEYIDLKKVYSVGFLLGSTSSMLLSSVNLDSSSYKNQCKENQSLDCNWYKKNNIDLSSFNEVLTKKIKTKIAIKKAILFDVELSKLFHKSSILSSSTKFYFVNLSKMKLLDNSHLKSLSSLYSKINQANVFSSFSLCTKKGKILLKGSKNEPEPCFESEKSKSVIHKMIIDKILENLKNKKD